jgi:uncharacterized protein DUF1707
MPTDSRRSFRLGGPDLRVGDAERNVAAELLAKHYADGRLDEAEYNERLGKVQAAKTTADFAGLFSDLPDLPGTETPRVDRGIISGHTRSGRLLPRLLFLVLVVVVVTMVAHTLIFSSTTWLLLGLLAALWLWTESRKRW